MEKMKIAKMKKRKTQEYSVLGNFCSFLSAAAFLFVILFHENSIACHPQAINIL